MTEQLKPCPFCGGAATTIETPLLCGDTLFIAGCTRCRARTEQWYPREAAIKAWNRRPAPSLDDLPAAVDEEIERGNSAGAYDWMTQAGKANLRCFVANAVKIWLGINNKNTPSR